MTFLSSLTLGIILKLLTNFEVLCVHKDQAKTALTKISNALYLVQKNIQDKIFPQACKYHQS